MSHLAHRRRPETAPGWITPQAVVAALNLELPTRLNEGNARQKGARRLRIAAFPEEFTVTEAPLTRAEKVRYGHLVVAQASPAPKTKPRLMYTELPAEPGPEDEAYYDRVEEICEAHRQKVNGMRSRARLMRKARMLRPDRMFTLTSSGPIYSRRRWHDVLTRFWRLVAEAGLEVDAIVVDELHQGGGINHNGWHSHFAVRGFLDLAVCRRCWHRALRDRGHEGNNGTPGGINLAPPMEGMAKQRYRKLVAYLAKYLTKTFSIGDLVPNAQRWRTIGKIGEPQELVVYVTPEQIRDLPRALEILNGCAVTISQVEIYAGEWACVYTSEALPKRGLLRELYDYPLSERRV